MCNSHYNDDTIHITIFTSRYTRKLYTWRYLPHITSITAQYIYDNIYINTRQYDTYDDSSFTIHIFTIMWRYVPHDTRRYDTSDAYYLTMHNDSITWRYLPHDARLYGTCAGIYITIHNGTVHVTLFTSRHATIRYLSRYISHDTIHVTLFFYFVLRNTTKHATIFTLRYVKLTLLKPFSHLTS